MIDIILAIIFGIFSEAFIAITFFFGIIVFCGVTKLISHNRKTAVRENADFKRAKREEERAYRKRMKK